MAERTLTEREPNRALLARQDGRVAGTWAIEGDRVRVEPFERPPRSARRELRDETECLEAFLA